jgi:predicted dehydrogenase/aryl-alcohol dehydrogenase-like predicted oxidoreductase
MAGTRWGIIGPGAIAHNFADGLREAASGSLVAIASRNADRRASFGDAYAIAQDMRFADYDSLMACPDIDAIYISTPHPFHAPLAIQAMRAGKAVLVEKPAGLGAGEVTAMTEVAAQENVFFMEAYMYRCHPQIARMIEIIQSGEIGQVTHIRAAFGFDAPFNAGSRLYDRELAGGAILDVGGYPMSLARLVAGVANGQNWANPVSLRGTGIMAESGVDAVAHAVMSFDGGVIAEIAVAVARNMDNSATITGTKGSITLADPWTPGRNAGPSDTTITVDIGDTSRVEELRHKEHLFAFEAECASAAIAAGEKHAPFPAMTPAESIANNTCLDMWRSELGYVTHNATVAGNRRIDGVLPKGLPQISKIAVEGVEAPISNLIMGCDNRDNVADGAIVWDAFMEAGGNCFDTAFVYGGGAHEEVLGQWIKARGVEKEVMVVGKGAHSPYCTPRAIETQLMMSLDRMGLSRVPIYIMHRDNLDVPIGEFVEALNALYEKGLIGAFGGSNWTTERIIKANKYAARNGLEPMRLLNNNLSLAVMERPIWDGCITSNSAETLTFLRETNTCHISWSSQARGFFLPAELRDRLPADIGPDACFGSAANEERRRRAELLAAELGVSPFNIATAWVLAQSFPSLAVIGPRSPNEIITTLPALNLSLSANDVAWLNLEADDR